MHSLEYQILEARLQTDKYEAALLAPMALISKRYAELIVKIELAELRLREILEA